MTTWPNDQLTKFERKLLRAPPVHDVTVGGERWSLKTPFMLGCRLVYLESSICIDRALPEVWAFFADPMNLTKWDRSVERVVITGGAPAAVGFTFDTFGPATHGSGFHSSYRVTEYVPGEHVWVDLTNARLFSSARWLTALESIGGGTRVTIGIALTFRLRYVFLWPVFRLTARAIASDLAYLKRALESESM